MDWSLVVFLGLGMFSLVLIMGIIIFGTRKSVQQKNIETMLREFSRAQKSEIESLKNMLAENEVDKNYMRQRLQNLETIVSNEQWEAENKARIHLDEDISISTDDRETKFPDSNKVR